MIDPGSGAGGITITSINGTQLPTALAPSQIATTASGLAYSRVTQTFNGTVTIKNVSANSITAPLQLVLTGISAGVTLSDATNDLSGTPYLTIPGVNGLAPGNSLVVNVRFKNPSNTIIKFQPLVYSGAIN